MDVKQLDFSSNPAFDQHEGVYFAHDARSGLEAIIAIHSTKLGPAAGGCRRWSYADRESAVTDALRLARGMSFKNAMAGLPFGGGKAVLLADPNRAPTKSEFEAFGRFVHALAGRYVTAEDVGVSTDHMRVVREQTPYVSGLPQQGDAAGGDPSPWTALGVFLSLQRAVAPLDLADLTVAVQGVGHVGYHLCRLLHHAGAALIVADIQPAVTARVVEEFGARVVSVDQILTTSADVLAPCALGGAINERSIPELNARLIAGAANNQLAEETDATRLHDRGILLLPDYVINAGGIIAVAREYLGGSTQDDLQQEVGRIPDRVAALLKTSKALNLPPSVVADRTAQQLIGRSPMSVSAESSVGGPATVHDDAAAGHEA
ncbi:MAG: Glu/Leu/Phe/Val dehydrogenase dimerization domain-containing protein [Pseudomonadota bacterium]